MSNIEKLSTARRANKKSSAVSDVHMSGLELTLKRKRRGRMASLREMARMDWEPWEKTDKPGPSAETMNYLGFYCRVSAAIMTRTKVELIKMHSDLEHKVTDQMLAGILDTGETLKVLASMTEGAYARVLASASAHHVAGGKFKGVHDMRKRRRTLRQH
jgi:hypothetical protein